jgi:L-threonylcarbamoyladenylate synthase
MSAKSATTILKYSAENLTFCCQQLAAGKLVGMPTETVYGLGANALDAAACKSIFTTKGRPLTDPLIVHVYSLDQAMGLVDPNQHGALKIFQTLAQ